ncbi:hypothetical protein ACFL4W_01470 [Planctomycetota bacterium]
MIVDNAQKEMWRAFWADEPLPRPLLKAEEYKNDTWASVADRYYKACQGQFQQLHEEFLGIFDNVIYHGEKFPVIGPELGPDAFAAFISGTNLEFSEGSKGTNWIHPVFEDYDSFDFSLNEDGPVWKGCLEYTKYLADNADGRYIVATIDLHSNIDALSALRGPQNLCMDLLDCPEKVDMAMQKIRALYPVVYNKLYEAGNMKATGSTGWIDLYCEGKFTVIQADFICMISPDQYDRFVHPALEEEANFLDHSFLHLDGPGALIHLDRILQIEKLDGIQWVSGAGQKPMHEWIDVFKKVQKAGKKLVIYGLNTLDIIKEYMDILDPRGLVLYIGEKTQDEFDEIAGWLEKNT